MNCVISVMTDDDADESAMYALDDAMVQYFDFETKSGAIIASIEGVSIGT